MKPYRDWETCWYEALARKSLFVAWPTPMHGQVIIDMKTLGIESECDSSNWTG